MTEPNQLRRRRTKSTAKKDREAGTRSTSHTANRGKGIAEAVRAELALIAGVVTTVIFFTVGETWLANIEVMAWLAIMFVWLFSVMVWCVFGVVRHDDALAELLGEPYGTLILTVSVNSIEVTIIATMMLGGAPNPTLPRDTMFATLMIVLNGIIGTMLAIGGLRYAQQQYNLQGAIAFLAVIAPLAMVGLVVPRFSLSTADSSFTPQQAIFFGLLTALLYTAFLIIQTTRHRGFFIEPERTRNGSGEAAVETYGKTTRLWN